MNQNINLLSSLPKVPRWNITLKHMLWIAGAWLAMLILFYSFFSWQASGEKAKLDRLMAEKNAVSKRLEELTKQLGQVSKNTTLQKEVESLTTDVKSRQELINILSQFGSDKAGFLRYLQALAEHTPEGIWLREITIDHDKNIIILKGSATSSALVPNFLESLNKTPAFKDKKFVTFQVNQSENGKEIEFVLRTLKDNDGAK